MFFSLPTASSPISLNNVGRQQKRHTNAELSSRSCITDGISQIAATQKLKICLADHPFSLLRDRVRARACCAIPFAGSFSIPTARLFNCVDQVFPKQILRRTVCLCRNRLTRSTNQYRGQHSKSEICRSNCNPPRQGQSRYAVKTCLWSGLGGRTCRSTAP